MSTLHTDVCPNNKTYPVRSIHLQINHCPFPKRQILDASKLKQFAHNNCKFDGKMAESSQNE